MTSVVDTGEEFVANVVDTGKIIVANVLDTCEGFVTNVIDEEFLTGIVDTDKEFVASVAGVVNSSGNPKNLEYLYKKTDMIRMHVDG